MPEVKTKSLAIEREFNAPVEMVWKAWTDEESIKKWWGPRGWGSPVAKIDFRVGGKYLLAMRGQMGPGMPEVENWSGGTYQEIIPMKKIVVLDHFADSEGNMVHASTYGLPQSFPMESQVIMTFEDLGGRTKLTVFYPDITGIEGEMLKNMTMGWNQSLDKLAEAVQ